jgi:acetylornithine deacetylase
MRLVLTTDEEAGQSTCVRSFLETPLSADLAVIAEPTEGRAVTQHRGIVSGTARFGGESGHASQGPGRSAVHAAVRWMAKCLDSDTAAEVRLNFGRIEGGVKPNMVAASAEVLYGFRPRPGLDHAPVLKELRGHAPFADHADRFIGPALPSSDEAKAAQKRAREAAEVRGLTLGDPVEFWTEASLFAAAGVPAMVLGPGHIGQAHAADEWVAYDSLLATYDAYARIVNG